MNETKQLPEGWKEDLLGNIFHTTSGGTPSRKNVEYYNGNILWVKSGELDKGLITDTEEKITEEAVKNSSAKIFPKGTLLIALYGATIGKLGFLGVDATTNQAICGIFENDKMSLKFLYHYLFHKRNKLIEQGAGGAQPNISQTILKNLVVPIPPLPEQHRIVGKIEELFSSLEKGIECLKTAQAQLLTYRQAVLKYAFEGKLTHPNLPEGSLPAGWEEKKIHEISDVFGGLAFKSGNFKSEGKYQVLRIGNIKQGRIRLEENPVFLSIIDEKTVTKGLLKINDIVITQTGTKGKRDYGFTALIKKDKLLLNQRNAVIRCNTSCLPKFLQFYTWTDLFRNQFFANETGNVGQGNVGVKGITDTIIFLPSLPEQESIVGEIETRLSVCDSVQASIEANLTKAGVLRQSILKRAFEGKL